VSGLLASTASPRTRAFRALWIANELGLDYEHLPIEIGDAGARSPEFLRLNPNGRLPFIDDEGFVLFESLAITMYLAKKHSHGKLYPSHLHDQAKTWQWSFWAVTEVERGVNIWSLHAARLPDAERDPGKRHEALKVLTRPFNVLDAALATQDYLLGGGFTVADLNVAAVISRAIDGPLGRAESQVVADALRRAAGRPRSAGAQSEGRRRDAAEGHAPDREDQPALSSAGVFWVVLFCACDSDSTRPIITSTGPGRPPVARSRGIASTVLRSTR
jgi:glutathione S-transferase